MDNCTGVNVLVGTDSVKSSPDIKLRSPWGRQPYMQHYRTFMNVAQIHRFAHEGIPHLPAHGCNIWCGCANALQLERPVAKAHTCAMLCCHFLINIISQNGFQVRLLQCRRTACFHPIETTSASAVRLWSWLFYSFSFQLALAVHYST